MGIFLSLENLYKYLVPYNAVFATIISRPKWPILYTKRRYAFIYKQKRFC